MEILKSSHEGGGKPQRGEARFFLPGGRGLGGGGVAGSKHHVNNFIFRVG